MPAPDLHPFPFVTLVDRLDRELRQGDAIYGLRRRDWWTPAPGRDLSLDHLGHRLATPAGPASGPHTQLAQNLVLSWLAGGRFLELKTVQVRDDLEIPRPCIFVPHVGYNVEWSQELLVQQSALEYVKGWMLIHLLAGPRGPGLWPEVGTVFDVSVGYDLAGIRSDKVRGYLDAMRDAGPLIDGLWAELPPRLQGWADTPVPRQVANSITLSTFHGCPADEIEAISGQLLDWGWHTVVKLNPTLLGHDRARAMLDRLGYAEPLVQLDPAAFERDLQWGQLLDMVPRLQARAAARGLHFGVKLSNTLVMHSPEPPFAPGEAYLSGPPLYALAVRLAAEVRQAFPTLPITFSAGVDARTFPLLAETGIAPLTACSDLLKGNGYARMTRYLRALEERLGRAGAADLATFRAEGPRALQALADGVLDDAALHRAQNSVPPRKVGTHLELLDCLTCDKCIPVCPNAANFAFDVPTGRWQPGRLRWDGPTWTLSEGAPLIADKRHQIGNTPDACNLCGQCDPWCPEDGGPYLVKPNLYASPASFDAHPERDGFVLSPDRTAITWRQGAARYTYTLTASGADFQTPTGTVSLVDDAPVATSGAGDVDLRVAVTMRLFLASFRRPDAAVWLPPLDALSPASPASEP